MSTAAAKNEQSIEQYSVPSFSVNFIKTHKYAIISSTRMFTSGHGYDGLLRLELCRNNRFINRSDITITLILQIPDSFCTPALTSQTIEHLTVQCHRN